MDALQESRAPKKFIWRIGESLGARFPNPLALGAPFRNPTPPAPPEIGEGGSPGAAHNENFHQAEVTLRAVSSGCKCPSMMHSYHGMH